MADSTLPPIDKVFPNAPGAPAAHSNGSGGDVNMPPIVPPPEPVLGPSVPADTPPSGEKRLDDVRPEENKPELPKPSIFRAEPLKPEGPKSDAPKFEAFKPTAPPSDAFKPSGFQSDSFKSDAFKPQPFTLGETKPPEPKPFEARPTEPKPAETKPDLFRPAEPKPEEKKPEPKRDILDGSGPAVGLPKPVETLSVPNGPKPVEVMSVPQTPANGNTPAGGTPRPELPLTEEPAARETPKEEPAIMTGVEKTFPTPKSSLSKENSIPEPIVDMDVDMDSGLNGAQSKPVEMTGALQTGTPTESLGTPTAPKDAFMPPVKSSFPSEPVSAPVQPSIPAGPPKIPAEPFTAPEPVKPATETVAAPEPPKAPLEPTAAPKAPKSPVPVTEPPKIPAEPVTTTEPPKAPAPAEKPATEAPKAPEPSKDSVKPSIPADTHKGPVLTSIAAEPMKPVSVPADATVGSLPPVASTDPVVGEKRKIDNVKPIPEATTAPAPAAEPVDTSVVEAKIQDEPDAKKVKPNGEDSSPKAGRPRKGSKPKKPLPPVGRTARKTRSQGPVET